MILMGARTDAEFEAWESKHHKVVTLDIVIDTSEFEYQIGRLARTMTRLDFHREVRNLSEHQVDALLYTRGAFDPEFAGEHTRDLHLKVIASHPTMGTVAASAFLRGWTTHRPGAGPVNPFAWHRYFGSSTGRGTEVRVDVA